MINGLVTDYIIDKNSKATYLLSATRTNTVIASQFGKLSGKVVGADLVKILALTKTQQNTSRLHPKYVLWPFRPLHLAQKQMPNLKKRF